ncbi:SIS domain-containing protein [Ancylobacter pratisalsi]|uniref:SIS domain-containing protein n=1 Tax=Ancylobacter pratisalsi TaxID=1745854 RepID=A0A6P1YRB9_9HYPH|nr:SIS domain-containing protein [Ancylobacter pratisalsi]QIB35246.1 SIS domain-containing protein [Ancylobacter pratisalsi]
MTPLHGKALDEIRVCLDKVRGDEFDAAVAEIAAAGRIALYGVGREGLQIKGLAMRLFHLGLKAAVVGDMTTPPVGPGDLLVVSAGPGDFSTVSALLGVARASGARTLVVTAEPKGAAAAQADLVLTVPAQTMASDQGTAAASVLPMGSLYEGALYVLFEILILSLRDRLDVPPARMRANHTNLE